MAITLTSAENTAIHPVARVAPVLSVSHIGDALQELNARAVLFAKGTHYPALVTSKFDDGTFMVRIGQSSYKMNLGASVTIGQHLLLQYLNDSPVPTFGLLGNGTAHAEKNNAVSSTVSAAAHFIDESLKLADVAGSSARYEAKQVVTHFPSIPQLVAQNLKDAIEQSGLFYESHLRQYHEGHRALSELRAEPQNQSNTNNTLLPQQLAILENQRLSWHGEIWPGQKMDWDVYLKDDKQESGEKTAASPESVFTDLTLDLPHLGKVTAKLSLVDGRMHIGLFAEKTEACSQMKAQSVGLIDAIKRNGQKLDGLTVASYV